MAKLNRQFEFDDEEESREMIEAADRISDLFEEYEITPADIEQALNAAAEETLLKMYPELLAEAG